MSTPANSGARRRPVLSLVHACLLAAASLAGAGCAASRAAPSPSSAAPSPASAPELTVTEGATAPGYLALEARPSARAASLLPEGAHYRVVVGDEELALVVTTPDGRIHSRLHLRPEAGDPQGSSVRLDHEDGAGRATSVHAWAHAGRIEGRASDGEHDARWRVRQSLAGQLEGERWSGPFGAGTEAGHDGLLRARLISGDLELLALTLIREGAIDDATSCRLHELVKLASVAVDLSLRAWTRRQRAQLPALDDLLVAERCAG